MFENILFRAKKNDKYDGEWLTSSLIQIYPKGILLGELDKDIASQVNNSFPETLKDYVYWYPVKPETLCWALTYCTFDVDDNAEKRPIFDKDLVEITFPGGTKRRYAVWYMDEGSCFEAIPWDEEDVKNGDALFIDYPVNFKNEISWDQFVFMLQDPYGEIISIKVIGNYVDNPELFPSVYSKENKTNIKAEKNNIIYDLTF